MQKITFRLDGFHLRTVQTRNLPSLATKQRVKTLTRSLAPTFLVLAFATAAHAQGTIDLSSANTLMTTVKTFAEYAGAVICMISLIFAGIKMMSGNFAQAIPGLGGAIFGAAVLGWGAGWISSLTGQSVSMIAHQSNVFLG